jgi:putative intracellular protease/amidase
MRNDVPPDLLPVLARMMARNPAERYQTPAEVAQALAPFARTPPAARPQAASPLSRRLLRVLIGATVALVVVTVGVLASAALRYAFTPAAAVVPPPQQPPGLPRVLVVLPHNGFYPPDWEPVRDTLQGKAQVTVASSATSNALSHDGKKQQKVDVRLADARVEQFDAVVFVGGMEPNEFFGNTPDANVAHQFLGDMLRAGKHVGTLCKGTRVLAETSNLPKIHAARSKYVPPEVMKRNDAIEWEAAPVVVSGHVVTGCESMVGKEFTLKLLETLVQSRRDNPPK